MGYFTHASITANKKEFTFNIVLPKPRPILVQFKIFWSYFIIYYIIKVNTV